MFDQLSLPGCLASRSIELVVGCRSIVDMNGLCACHGQTSVSQPQISCTMLGCSRTGNHVCVCDWVDEHVPAVFRRLLGGVIKGWPQAWYLWVAVLAAESGQLMMAVSVCLPGACVCDGAVAELGA